MNAVGLTRDHIHRYSWNGDRKVPGVTTVMGKLDKSGPLVAWAKQETARCAVRNLDLIGKMIEDSGVEAAQSWLQSIPDYQRDAAADLGSSVHALAEALSLGQDVAVTEEEAPFVEAYIRGFLERFKPKIRLTEFMVYSEEHRYGGTADVACVIDGDLWLLDYKTSGKIYSETSLQLAGLRWADFVGYTGDPQKYAIPPATRFGVVHIRPEGAELVPYHVTPREFEAFLACRLLWGWVNERAPQIKGEAA